MVISKLDKTAMIKADRHLFARLLVIAQTRHLDMRQVLEYELGPIPWSIACNSGSLIKTNKAVLSHAIEKNTEQTGALPNGCVWIFDAMAVIQSVSKLPDTFQELASIILSTILNMAKDACRVDFVADQYPDLSIKSTERKARSSAGQVITKITRSSQPCPRQWKKFLSVGCNKTSLIDFLVEEWSNESYRAKLEGKQLYVAHGNDCHMLSVENDILTKQTCSDLCSAQEEADTKMFLHVQHAAKLGYESVVIKSSDTDVEILACYYQQSISAKLFIVSGTSSKYRVINVTSICNKLDKDICQALPGLHAVTGCDSVSAFSGKGKAKAFNVLQKNTEFAKTLSKLGQTLITSAEMLKQVEVFICAVYGFTLDDINEVRFLLFCKSKHIQCHQLPPTKDALDKHIIRANYQCYVWKRALQCNAVIPLPDKHGWSIDDNCLEIDWMDQQPASDSLMLLISCACKTTCSTKRCSCVQQGLACTDGCKCSKTSCQNIVKASQEDTDDSCEDEDVT